MAVPKFIEIQLKLSLLMGRLGAMLEVSGVEGVEYVRLHGSFRGFVEKNCGGAVYVANMPYPGYKKVTLTRVQNGFVNRYRGIEVCASSIERLFHVGAKRQTVVLYFRPHNLKKGVR